MVHMLEHESSASPDATTTRSTTSIETLNVDRTFLIKKMEIQFIFTPGGDSGTTTPQHTGHPMYLVFFHNDGTAANTAAALDGGFQDPETHNDIVWMAPFIFKPAEVDDAGGWAVQGTQVALTRIKSFPKGYPLDKNDSYTWLMFNPSTATAPDPAAINSLANLRVRYWGVYVG